MGPELRPIADLNLSQLQIHNLQLLQMNSLELSHYVEQLAMDNPMIELPDIPAFQPAETDDRFLAKWQWLEDSDHQNHFYKPFSEEEEYDVFASIGSSGGLEITLPVYLKEQAERLKLDSQTSLELDYLIDSVDEKGYLRMTAEEIAEDTGLPEERIRRAVSLLQSMDPPGVGAFDLAECLTLQLERKGADALTKHIAGNYLGNLARHQYRRIAEKEKVSEAKVVEAAEQIRSLDPNPARDYAAEETAIYVQPDVYVDYVDGEYRLRTPEERRDLFQVNEYYFHLMKKSEDAEVCRYLREKMAQIDSLNYGLQQRRSTLENLCRFLIDRQQEFFRRGPQALRPLSMAEAAEELGVHISTISRTVKNKYLQYPGGLVPIRLFFVRAVAMENNEIEAVGSDEIKVRLRKLLEREDRTKPMADKKIAELLAEEGFRLSRRTVAKYRDELGIPSAAYRKQ